jgi:hypothetical protein
VDSNPTPQFQTADLLAAIQSSNLPSNIKAELWHRLVQSWAAEANAAASRPESAKSLNAAAAAASATAAEAAAKPATSASYWRPKPPTLAFKFSNTVHAQVHVTDDSGADYLARHVCLVNGVCYLCKLATPRTASGDAVKIHEQAELAAHVSCASG